MSDLLQNLSYEEALAALEAIVKDLEAGKISMDQLDMQVRKANDLVAYCEQKLGMIEEKLKDARDDRSTSQEDSPF